MFIGATNRVELLDKSALRPGRLDRCIYVGVQTERVPLLRTLTRRMLLDQSAPGERRGEQREACMLEVLNTRIRPEFTAADCEALCATAGMVVLKRKVRFLQKMSRALSIPECAVLEILGCFEQHLRSNGISGAPPVLSIPPADFTNPSTSPLLAWLIDLPWSPLRLRLLYDTTSETAASSCSSVYDVQLWLMEGSADCCAVHPQSRRGAMKLWLASTLPKGWLSASRDISLTVEDGNAPPNLLLDFETPSGKKLCSRRGRGRITQRGTATLPHATLAGAKAFLWAQVPQGGRPQSTLTTQQSCVKRPKTGARGVHCVKSEYGTCWRKLRSPEERAEPESIAPDEEDVISHIAARVEHSEWSVFELLRSKVALQDFIYALECTRQSLTAEELSRYEKSRLTYSRR